MGGITPVLLGKKSRTKFEPDIGESHRLPWLIQGEVTKIQCPDGWMSPEGYNRYVRKTLSKMKQRLKYENTIYSLRHTCRTQYESHEYDESLILLIEILA